MAKLASRQPTHTIDNGYSASYYVIVKNVEWNSDKNAWLRVERGISFEDIKIAMDEEHILHIIGHPNSEKYPEQKMMVVDINGYAYCVPFVDDGDKWFLKTIFPSRKMTKKYIIGEKK